MNWADAVIVVVILLSLLIGVLRGLTRELLGAVAWVLAFWVAFTFVGDAARWLSAHISTPSVQKAVGFAALFIVTLFTGSVVAFFAAKAMRESSLAGVDRTLGGGFGFLRGMLVVATLIMVAGVTPAKEDAWWRNSFFIPHLEWTGDALRSVMPRSWLAAIEPDEEPVKPALPDHKTKPGQKSPSAEH